MLELANRRRTQPAPARVVWQSLMRRRDPGAHPWLELLADEVDPQILESAEPVLVVWSSLWPDRPHERIRFDLVAADAGCQLRWTLLTAGPRPTGSQVGQMRSRLNALINERLRLSYGQ